MEYGRRGVGRDGVHEKPGAAVGGRDGERRAADIARHARKPDGSGSAAVQEERGGRSETQLFGTPGDGKPEWADCEVVCDAVGDARRTAGSLGDDGTDREEGEGEGEGEGRKGTHVGSGQGLSEEGID